MHWLRRYRVGLVLLGLLVAGGVLELRRHGLGLREAVVRAGRTRLHRIVMTTLTALVGLVPMALGIDVGSEANPLARAVIGGLAVSTVLMRVLIPTLYVILEERFPRRIESPEGVLVAQGDAA
jgi:multidrug efflux pump subunit AcrB